MFTPTDRRQYLADLATRDEDSEALLAGGADIDDLIEAGVLNEADRALPRPKQRDMELKQACALLLADDATVIEVW